MISATKAKNHRIEGYQQRSGHTKTSLVTIGDLEKLNASCGNCHYRKIDRCTLKKNKQIKTYNICTSWKDDNVKQSQQVASV